MKCEEGNGSDITPFSRSDVRGTREIKARVIKSLETRAEFQKFRGGEEIRGGSESSGNGVGRDADRTNAGGIRLVSVVP